MLKPEMFVSIPFFTVNLQNTDILIIFCSIILLLIFSAFTSHAGYIFSSYISEKSDEFSVKKNKFLNSVILSPEKYSINLIITKYLVYFVIIRLLYSYFNTENNPVVYFQIIVSSIVIFFFGELVPKSFANRAERKISLFYLIFIFRITVIFLPLSLFFLKFSSFLNKRIFTLKKHENSFDELTKALQKADSGIQEDKEILEGIVSFIYTDVCEIITPRIDVVSLEQNSKYDTVIKTIADSGFSRIPVYKESPDDIIGILYTKDLIEHRDNDNDYQWQKHIREPFFVPENIKINDLLHEFQTNNNHIAIVSDEYGGVSGIVTLEDILEEILGEISDESDEENELYKKIDSNTFIFEAKIMLNDLCKILFLDDSYFDSIRGDAESLGGLILELKGEIPQKDVIIRYKNISLFIISSDSRKINRVKLTIL